MAPAGSDRSSTALRYASHGSTGAALPGQPVVDGPGGTGTLGQVG